jgi:hypothetical protein
MLIHPGSTEAVRRFELQRLDTLLSELESLNLEDRFKVPENLGHRLRRAGVGYPREATVSEVIDLVFRAQERFLQPLETRTGKRSAA